MAALEPLAGTVSRVNDKGFQLSERPGSWLNISQYAEPRPALPEAGQRVALGLDGKGFVRTITPATADDVTSAAAPPTRVPATAATCRETTITRLAVLKVAATFAASRPDMKSPDMLNLAERLEAWVLR